MSDGLGAKGLPDLRLGLALAFVLTTPLATLCIEHILSCPVWRVSLPIARCFTGGTVGSGLSSAVALVLHTLGRIRWLPVAGSGPRGRVSSLPAPPSVLVTGLAAPSQAVLVVVTVGLELVGAHGARTCARLFSVSLWNAPWAFTRSILPRARRSTSWSGVLPQHHPQSTIHFITTTIAWQLCCRCAGGACG